MVFCMPRWIVLEVLLFITLCHENRSDERTKVNKNKSPVYKYTITDAFVVRVQDFMASPEEANTLVTEFPLPVEAIPGADAVLELIGRRLHNNTMGDASGSNVGAENDTSSSTNQTSFDNALTNKILDSFSSNIANTDKDYNYLYNGDNTNDDLKRIDDRAVLKSLPEIISKESKGENLSDRDNFDDRNQKGGDFSSTSPGNNNHSDIDCGDASMDYSKNTNNSKNSSSSINLCNDSQIRNKTGNEKAYGYDSNETISALSFDNLNKTGNIMNSDSSSQDTTQKDGNITNYSSITNKTSLEKTTLKPNETDDRSKSTVVYNSQDNNTETKDAIDKTNPNFTENRERLIASTTHREGRNASDRTSINLKRDDTLQTFTNAERMNKTTHKETETLTNITSSTLVNNSQSESTKSISADESETRDAKNEILKPFTNIENIKKTTHNGKEILNAETNLTFLNDYENENTSIAHHRKARDTKNNTKEDFITQRQGEVILDLQNDRIISTLESGDSIKGQTKADELAGLEEDGKYKTIANFNTQRQAMVGIDLENGPAMSTLESGSSINGQTEAGVPSGFDRVQIKKVSNLVQQKLLAFLTDQRALYPQNQTKNGNFSRQSTSGHVIELLFVVDFVLYSTFLQRNGLNAAATLLDIQTFYSQVLRATNERYATATSGSFSVTLTLSGIFVAQTAVASPWTELFKDALGNVNPMVASPSFSSFALGLNLTFPHDLAVLFTGYNLLINAVTPSPGYTPVPGLLCSVIGVVWIQETLDELTPLNLARFSAQSIGIQNDGPNGCSNDNLNVMSTSTLLPSSTALASNPWTFSSCSVTELANMLDNTALACTKQTSNLFPFNTAPFLGELFGQRYDADSQCRNSRRPTSRFCRELYFPPSTLAFDPDMCRNLLCQDGVSCVQTLAHDGTSCGNSKVCMRGQCIPSLLSPFRPPNCPQLDDPTITCTAASCFDATLRTVQCCGTCNGLVETSTAFPFGVSTFFFQEEAFFDFEAAALVDDFD